MYKTGVSLFSLFLLLLLAATTKISAQKVGDSYPPTGPSFRFDMAAELKRLAAQDTFPIAFGYKSHEAIKSLQKSVRYANSPSKHAQIKQWLAYAYLKAGMPDSAIATMLTLPDVPMLMDREKGEMVDRDYFLGLCWLSKAELDNCKDNHNSTSCIVPFTEDAVHINKTGSRHAIEYLKRALAKNPNNLKARWLINIAYITLGLYPDNVPYQYLIDINRPLGDYTLPRFENVAGATGTDLLTYYGSAITEDFDNDGAEDIFTSTNNLTGNTALYVRLPDGSFMDMAKESGVAGIGSSAHAIQADFDNDGYTDIYLLRGGWVGPSAHLYPNSLLKNNGNGTFTDITAQAGLLHYGATHTAAWADVNKDGYLDLFVGVEEHQSKLYINNHNGTFREEAEESGIKLNAFVKGAFWGDVNGDTRVDLYVSVYGGDNLLYINQGHNKKGRVTFKNEAKKWGVTAPFFSFGTFMFDYNNDGALDIFCTNYNMDLENIAREYMGEFDPTTFSALYKNGGDAFKDVAALSGLNRSIQAMGLNFADIDNDGYLDLYAGTGFPDLAAQIPNLLMRNNNGDVFKESRTSGLGHLQKTHGISFADLDKDGDLDVYASIGGFFVPDEFWNALFENPGNDNHWISLNLQGVKANRSAIGANIKLTLGDKTIYRILNSGGSYGSNPLRQHIGVGAATIIDKIEIVWPGSLSRTVLENVVVDKGYHLTEGDTQLTEVEYNPIPFKKKVPIHGHEHHRHDMHWFTPVSWQTKRISTWVKRYTGLWVEMPISNSTSLQLPSLKTASLVVQFRNPPTPFP